MSACNAGDLGSTPGLGRSPEGGNGNLLQYPCLEKSHLLIFALAVVLVVSYPGKSVLRTNFKEFFPIFSSKSFMVSGLVSL